MTSGNYQDSANPAQSECNSRLPTARLIAFSMAAVPLAAAQLPLTIYLPAIYAQQFGISLALIGTIFFFGKIFGAFMDPIIGLLSDRTRSRFGRRRPYIIVGGIIFFASATLLFFPPKSITTLYLIVVILIFYLSWSLIQIPYLAWSGQISTGYNERTRVSTYQMVASSTTFLVVLLLPTIIDHARPGDNIVKLGALGAVLLVALFPAITLTLWSFPEPKYTALPPQSSKGFGKSVRVVLSNGMLMRVLASDLFVTIGQSIRGSLFVFFISSYMGLSQWASTLFLLQFIFGIAAGPLWMSIGIRAGKHHAAVAGEIAQTAINLTLLLLAPGQIALLIGLTVAQGLAQGSGNLMLRSIVSDVADAHRLKTGEDHTALFFSVFSIAMKAGMAIAIGIALPLVALLGFDPKLQHNDPEALRGLLFVFALGPAIFHAASAALIVRFPLDAKAHAAIHQKLARQEYHKTRQL